jgi:tetratricopeptide (TPR) repeat protein
VALTIAREIKVQVTPQAQARLEEARVVDHEAYELYLWGKKFRDKETLESIQQALKYLEQAITKDPNFALAYAELVVPYFLSGALGIMPREEAISKARNAATKALELDETSAEAHTALGVIREFYDWDWSGAEEAFKMAIALNPRSLAENPGLKTAIFCRMPVQQIGGH